MKDKTLETKEVDEYLQQFYKMFDNTNDTCLKVNTTIRLHTIIDTLYYFRIISYKQFKKFLKDIERL